MPDKTLKVVTYAAGASLAAITLIYVFGPTYFLDNDASKASGGAFSGRRKGAVGLLNPANDCFINSVLQALAGLGDLRLYLIRELHRRDLDGESVYAQPVPVGALAEDGSEQAQPRFGKDVPDWKLEGLQRGSVTKSLKNMLDALNERPLYKKTISAAPFVSTLEEAFRQRISRQQQDAQEFLQVVAERLCDEYHAGSRARSFARCRVTADDASVVERPAAVEGVPLPQLEVVNGDIRTPGRVKAGCYGVEGGHREARESGVGDEEGFPLEGKFESQIECLTCGFKPRPTASTFCTLTLNVPRVASTTLGACFDGMFKTEYIDDFKCEKCRLLHAMALLRSDLQRHTTDEARAKAQADVDRLQHAIDKDPENPPDDVALPNLRHAPKRRIARHIRITEFPSILAIHLSRSIFDAGLSSQKNLAKVAFPEELPLGGLLLQQRYQLLGVVTHKGSHNSGHYESFRRQTSYPPFSNSRTFQASAAYSRKGSPAPATRAHDPNLIDANGSTSSAPTRCPLNDEAGAHMTPLSSRSAVTPSVVPPNSIASGLPTDEVMGKPRHSAAGATPRNADSAMLSQGPSETPRRVTPLKDNSPALQPKEGNSALGFHQPTSARSGSVAKSKQQKQHTRWWRISDDKVRESNTRDVLGMQREVYLLFYELERPHLSRQC